MARTARIALALSTVALPMAVWAGCTGDDPILTGTTLTNEAGADAAGTSPTPDASLDAGAGNEVDAAAPPLKDAGVDARCDLEVPNTTGRLMECGDGLLCNLDITSPPYRCCIGDQPDSGVCIVGEACPSPKIAWTCTRDYQCPAGAPCCLTLKNLTATCPPTATALDTTCVGTYDAGCGLNIELCTGNDDCHHGKTCQRLDILAPEHRLLGACL